MEYLIPIAIVVAAVAALILRKHRKSEAAKQARSRADNTQPQ